MTGKTVTIDFGFTFPTDADDRDRLVRRVEKNVQLNVASILEDGAYKHSMALGRTTPMKLKVTVELVSTEEHPSL